MFDKTIKIESIPTQGDVFTVQEGIKSEINADKWSQSTKPEVPFAKIFYLNDHDSRLYLASDTYVQLILGSGVVITGDSSSAVKKVQKWFADNYIEEKIEDVMHSYVIAGNAFFERLFKSKRMLDIDEIDVTTIVGAKRDKHNNISEYIQYVNDRENPLQAKDVAHLKFTSRRQELFGRSLFQSVVTPKVVDGLATDSSIEEMWKIERAMVKIFQAYASPMMMIHFEDVGEDFIKDKQQEFQKMGAGAKILTDKAFKAEVFEVNPASKFDKYIEHMEKDIIEAGAQFATQIFTAGFTARASSESSTDMIKLKIKRVGKRFGQQFTKQVIDWYLQGQNIDPKKSNIRMDFKFDSESVLTPQDVAALFEKGVIRRSEVRKYLAEDTTVEIDMDDMEDTAPITSVTPTNDMGKEKPEEKPEDGEKKTTAQKRNEELFAEAIESIVNDEKMTKKKMLEKLTMEVNERKNRELIRDKSEKELLDKKQKILDRIGESVGELKID